MFATIITKWLSPYAVLKYFRGAKQDAHSTLKVQVLLPIIF